MKLFFKITLLSLLTGCTDLSKEELLLGNWKAFKITDIEKKDTKNVSNYMDVLITKDSMFVKMSDPNDLANGNYTWFIKNDTVNVVFNSAGDIEKVKIGQITDEKLEVIMIPFLGSPVSVEYKKEKSN